MAQGAEIELVVRVSEVQRYGIPDTVGRLDPGDLNEDSQRAAWRCEDFEGDLKEYLKQALESIQRSFASPSDHVEVDDRVES